jgi:hypothetical protein
MLESMGFYIEDDQFKELCSHLSFHKNHMTYMDFVANFEDPRVDGPAVDIIKVNNHHVNHIRGDEIGMTAEMAEQRLINKLRENFGVRNSLIKSYGFLSIFYVNFISILSVYQVCACVHLMFFCTYAS